MAQEAQADIVGSEDAYIPSEFAACCGAHQFCDIYRKYKDLNSQGLLWGDETEYLIVGVQHDRKSAHVVPCASDFLSRYQTSSDDHGAISAFTVMPEYTEFQLETIPFQPFSGRLKDLGLVEDNMRARREALQRKLPPNTHLLTMTSFPRLDRPPEGPVHPESAAPGDLDDLLVSRSVPRHRGILRATQRRAGEAYGLRIPGRYTEPCTSNVMYEDVNTRWLGDTDTVHSRHVVVKDSVYGLGCNGLHVTVQTRNLCEARYLHDQLAVLSTVLIALTAGAPVKAGLLSEDDSRLALISDACDDRTSQQRKPQENESGEVIQSLPRFGPVGWFLSKEAQDYNDLKQVYNVPVYNSLVSKGVDLGMAMHAAIFFSHPVYVPKESQIASNKGYIKETRKANPEKGSTELFEPMNQSVWTYVRLKSPEADPDLGWRLEFRPMAIQPTDFENAAFAVFVLLLTRTLRRFSCDFLIPMSKVHENCRKALGRDAVTNTKFYFRSEDSSEELAEMTVDEIVNGTRNFPGLLSLVRRLIDTDLPTGEARCQVDEYLQMISDIASGERPTTARRIREFVLGHPEYSRDSSVTDRVQYDLVMTYLR